MHFSRIFCSVTRVSSSDLGGRRYPDCLPGTSQCKAAFILPALQLAHSSIFALPCRKGIGWDVFSWFPLTASVKLCSGAALIGRRNLDCVVLLCSFVVEDAHLQESCCCWPRPLPQGIHRGTTHTRCPNQTMDATKIPHRMAELHSSTGLLHCPLGLRLTSLSPL